MWLKTLKPGEFPAVILCLLFLRYDNVIQLSHLDVSCFTRQLQACDFFLNMETYSLKLCYWRTRRQLWNPTRFCASKSTIPRLPAPAGFMHLLLELKFDRRYQGTTNQQHEKKGMGSSCRAPKRTNLEYHLGVNLKWTTQSVAQCFENDSTIIWCEKEFSFSSYAFIQVRYCV